MNIGLTDKEFDFLRIQLIDPLKKKNAKVFLFGSRATGKYKKFSDIDILFIQDHEFEIPGNFIYSLLAKIEESAFPYKIDVVDYKELASSYREKVDSEKIEL